MAHVWIVAPRAGVAARGLRCDRRRVADDTRRVYRAVDLALRVGEVVLSSGAGAADVNAAVLSVTRACGLRAVHVDVNFTTLTVSYQSEAEEPPQTYLRTVTYRGLDYGLLTDVDRLVHALVHGEIDPATASQRLNELRSAARPFPRWMVSLSTGLMAAGVGLLLQGRPLVVAIAFATAIGIDQVVRQLACRRIPAFYQQVAGALVASIVAHGAYLLDDDVRPSVIVASGIIVLLAGITLVGAVQDALTGYYVTAAARTFEAMLLTGGIIAGVSLGITIGVRLGFDLPLTARSTAAIDDLPLALLGGTLVSISFALRCYAPLRSLAAVAAVGLTAQLTYLLLAAAGTGVAWSSATAAVVVGVMSYSLAGRVRVPPLVVVVSGIVGLLPGLTIYRGLFQLLTERDVGGLVPLMSALAVGVGLASGVLLGEYVAQPLKREARRLENRLAGPRLVGPLHMPSRRARHARRRRRAAAREERQRPADTQPG